MSIVVNGNVFKSLSDRITADGARVKRVYANGHLVYPDDYPVHLEASGLYNGIRTVTYQFYGRSYWLSFRVYCHVFAGFRWSLDTDAPVWENRIVQWNNEWDAVDESGLSSSKAVVIGGTSNLPSSEVSCHCGLNCTVQAPVSYPLELKTDGQPIISSILFGKVLPDREQYPTYDIVITEAVGGTESGSFDVTYSYEPEYYYSERIGAHYYFGHEPTATEGYAPYPSGPLVAPDEYIVTFPDLVFSGRVLNKDSYYASSKTVHSPWGDYSTSDPTKWTYDEVSGVLHTASKVHVKLGARDYEIRS